MPSPDPAYGKLLLCLASFCFITCTATVEGVKSYPQDPNTHFSGNKNRCGDQKRGGSECWPFHRYHKEMYYENPLWAQCCRPCLGKFGEDLALLDISVGTKKKIMKMKKFCGISGKSCWHQVDGFSALGIHSLIGENPGG